MGVWVSALLLTTAAAGCAGAPPVTPDAPPPSQPAAGDPPASASPELVRARRDAGIADCEPATGAPVPGGLPDLELSCLGGDSTVRIGGLRGPMVINLWAQWCGPCRQEAPYLAEFAPRAEAKGVRLMGVDFADPRPDLAIDFARQSGWHFAQLADPQRRLGTELQVVGPPQTLFIDSTGRIVHRHIGAFTSTDQLTALVQERLGVAV